MTTNSNHSQCPRCLTFNRAAVRRCEACGHRFNGSSIVPKVLVGLIFFAVVGGGAVFFWGDGFFWSDGFFGGDGSRIDLAPSVTAGEGSSDSGTTAGGEEVDRAFADIPANLDSGGQGAHDPSFAGQPTTPFATAVSVVGERSPSFLRGSNAVATRLHVFIVRGLSDDGALLTEGTGLLLSGGPIALVSLRTLLGAARAEAYVVADRPPYPIEGVLDLDAVADVCRVRIGGSFEAVTGLDAPRPNAFPGDGSRFRLWVADPVVSPPGALLRGELRLALSETVGRSALGLVPLEGAAPTVGGALLSEAGELVGWLHPSFPWEEIRLGSSFAPFLTGEPPLQAIDVSEFTRSRYRGSSRELLEAGLHAWIEGDQATATDRFIELLRLEPGKLDPYLDRVVATLLNAANTRRARGDVAGAIFDLRDAVTLLPARPRLRLLLGRLLLEVGLDLEAVDELIIVGRQDPSLTEELTGTIVDALLRVGDRHLRAGRSEEAFAVASKGVDLFSDQPGLFFLLGRVYLAVQNYEDAIVVLERALALDSGLARSVEPYLEEAERGLGGGPVVEIRYPPEARRIAVDMRVADRGEELFVLDTGATNTVLTPGAARRLGLPIDFDRQVTVSTAGGNVLAPLVNIPSLEIKGLIVYDLEAVVLELGDPKVAGLVGLDFLNHFVYSVDSKEGLLTLRAR